MVAPGIGTEGPVIGIGHLAVGGDCGYLGIGTRFLATAVGVSVTNKWLESDVVLGISVGAPSCACSWTGS